MRRGLSLLMCVLALAACESDDNKDAGDGKQENPAVGEAKSAVVLGTWIAGVEAGNTYLTASETLPDSVPDLSQALELPDGFVWQNDEALFFASFESGELERYDVSSDLKIERKDRLSLASYGIPYLNTPPVFVARDVAYYLAVDLGIGIVWNPSEMRIEREIDITAFAREGYSGRPGAAYIDGKKLYVPIRYTDDTSVGEDSAVGVIDLESDETSVLTDDRASAAWTGFVSNAGDFYMFADGNGGALALTGLQELPSTALLRIRKGTSEIDPDYLFDVGEAIGTSGIYGLWPVSDTHFLVQAWPSDLESDLETEDEYWSAPSFEWYVLDAAKKTVKKVSGVGTDIPQVLLPMTLDGRGFIQQVVPDSEEQGLFEVNPATAEADLKVTAPAAFWFLGRVETH